MITTAEARDRGGRVLRIALIASLLVHVIVGLIVVATSDEFSRLLARVTVHHRLQPKPDETEVVTISSALRIEKRARPAPAHAARRATVVVRPAPKVQPRPPVPQHVAVVPRPVVKPKPAVAPTRALPLPSVLERELSKFDRHAPSRVVASVPHPNPVQQPRPNPAAQPQPPSRAVRLSQEQIDQIERDLSQTIAQSRAEERVMSDVSRAAGPAAATKRYAFNMSGIATSRFGAEGICSPIKMWRADGYNYYYVSCTVTHDDGTVRYQVPVPWPVRYPPNADPLDPADSTVKFEPPIRVPGPLPGWNPPAAIDPDIRRLLHDLGYHV